MRRVDADEDVDDGVEMVLLFYRRAQAGGTQRHQPRAWKLMVVRVSMAGCPAVPSRPRHLDGERTYNVTIFQPMLQSSYSSSLTVMDCNLG